MDGKRVISFLFPLISLFVIVLLIDIDQFAFNFRNYPIALLFIVLISIIRPFAGGLRASITFSEIGELSIVDTSKGYVLSMYGSIFLPSAIGGDLLRLNICHR